MATRPFRLHLPVAPGDVVLLHEDGGGKNRFGFGVNCAVVFLVKKGRSQWTVRFIYRAGWAGSPKPQSPATELDKRAALLGGEVYLSKLTTKFHESCFARKLIMVAADELTRRQAQLLPVGVQLVFVVRYEYDQERVADGAAALTVFEHRPMLLTERRVITFYRRFAFEWDASLRAGKATCSGKCFPAHTAHVSPNQLQGTSLAHPTSPSLYHHGRASRPMPPASVRHSGPSVRPSVRPSLPFAPAVDMYLDQEVFDFIFQYTGIGPCKRHRDYYDRFVACVVVFGLFFNQL